MGHHPGDLGYWSRLQKPPHTCPDAASSHLSLDTTTSSTHSPQSRRQASATPASAPPLQPPASPCVVSGASGHRPIQTLRLPRSSPTRAPRRTRRVGRDGQTAGDRHPPTDTWTTACGRVGLRAATPTAGRGHGCHTAAGWTGDSARTDTASAGTA